MLRFTKHCKDMLQGRLMIFDFILFQIYSRMYVPIIIHCSTF